MPAALERALKRKIASKNWSAERKDAYVYGTLRKTGWKPSTQKKHNMSTIAKVIRLSSINKRLDQIIEFQYDDEEEAKRRGLLKTATVGAGAAGVGTAGLYGLGKLAPVSAGGQGLTLGGAVHDVGYGAAPVIRGIKQGVGIAGPAIASAAKTAYGTAAPVAQRGIGALGSLLKKIRLPGV